MFYASLACPVAAVLDLLTLRTKTAQDKDLEILGLASSTAPPPTPNTQPTASLMGRETPACRPHRQSESAAPTWQSAARPLFARIQTRHCSEMASRASPAEIDVSHPAMAWTAMGLPRAGSLGHPLDQGKCPLGHRPHSGGVAQIGGSHRFHDHSCHPVSPSHPIGTQPCHQKQQILA
jgi:hypothetical protein